MTISEMFAQSTALAILGMGMVFGFLAIMVVAVTFTGKIIHAVGADKDAEESAAPVSAPAAAGNAGAAVAVISAAVAEHRKNN